MADIILTKSFLYLGNVHSNDCQKLISEELWFEESLSNFNHEFLQNCKYLQRIDKTDFVPYKSQVVHWLTKITWM